jgi:hypothetical protein
LHDDQSVLLICLLSGLFLFRQAQMLVIDPLALKQMVPGSGLYIIAPVFVPLDVRLFPQHHGILVSSDHPQTA